MPGPAADSYGSSLTRLIHLFGLTSFAIAQPLLDLLGGNGAFFVAHAVRGPDLLIVMTGLLVLPPLLLWLVELPLALLDRRLGYGVHLVLVACLVAVACLAPLVQLAPDSTLGVSLGASAIALGMAWLYHRAAPLRNFVGLLAVAALAFVVSFLFQPDVRALLDSSRPTKTQPGAAPTLLGPVILIVFDELPLSSLLSADREIDRERVPAFAELADHSTWARGVSTVSPRTPYSVPAILTGRYPRARNSLAIESNYPRNLFTLLEATHHLHVVETRTLIHPRTREKTADTAQLRRCLIRDLATVYAHLIAPRRFREMLPRVDQDWACFGTQARVFEREEATPARGKASKQKARARRKKWKQQARAARKKWKRQARRDGRGSDDPNLFQHFARSIEAEHARAGADRGSLHFLHVTFPHTPWRFTPSGRFYEPYDLFGLWKHSWSLEPWWTLEAYQRHLLQVQFADRLVGELIEELRAAELYDESLLVITADHGVGFWPGETWRSLYGTSHPADILSVPLFIKPPHSNEPLRIDRISETIDILPTIADVLGMRIPWRVDGCSLYDEQCPAKNERRVIAKNSEKVYQEYRFPSEIPGQRETLDRRIAFFGSGDQSRLYRFGPKAALAGRRVDDLPIDSQGAGTLSRSGKSEPGDRDLRIVGDLNLNRPTAETPYVAVALNGLIETIVPARRAGEERAYRVAALLPEDHFTGEGDVVEVYLVEGEPNSPRLARLSLR